MSSEEIRTEDIYRDLSARLKSFILNRVNDENAAEDILHDVFLKIHTKVTDLKNIENLQSWIFRIARNSIIDFYRTRKLQVKIPEDLMEEEQSPSVENVRKQLAPGLRAMINSLPPRYREIMILTELRGYTQKEAAEKLGLPVSGAKSRVQRGREMLKQLLTDCCHFEFDRRGQIVDYQPKCQHCYTNVPKWEERNKE